MHTSTTSAGPYTYTEPAYVGPYVEPHPNAKAPLSPLYGKYDKFRVDHGQHLLMLFLTGGLVL